MPIVGPLFHEKIPNLLDKEQKEDIMLDLKTFKHLVSNVILELKDSSRRLEPVHGLELDRRLECGQRLESWQRLGSDRGLELGRDLGTSREIEFRRGLRPNWGLEPSRRLGPSQNLSPACELGPNQKLKPVRGLKPEQRLTGPESDPGRRLGDLKTFGCSGLFHGLAVALLFGV
jgi:hypothetical protein